MAPPRGRGRLHADIEAASVNLPDGVRQIAKGTEEDDFVFTFVHEKLPRGQIDILVTPQDVASYPGDTYFLVTTEDEVPSSVGEILNNATGSTSGKLVPAVIETLRDQLSESLDSAVKSDDKGENNSNDSLEAYDSDIELSYFPEDIYEDVPRTPTPEETEVEDPEVAQEALYQRLYKDLLAAHNAGFRVGKLDCDNEKCAYSIVCLSISVRKLLMTSKTRIARNLDPTDYIVLLIKYTKAVYAPFEDIMAGSSTSTTPVEFRLRKCDRSRPTRQEALRAFLPAEILEDPIIQAREAGAHFAGMLSTFVTGAYIESHLNKDFIELMKIKSFEGVSWDEATTIHAHTTQGSLRDDTDSVADNSVGDPENPASSSRASSTPSDLATKNWDWLLPTNLLQDALSADGPISLPLVAMQFTLRRLAKCAKYCIICFRKRDTGLDTLKPYVCSRPLCLYQYMSLNFCTQVDEEIIEQPYVVDLLVSFCYAGMVGAEATSQQGDFPMGLEIEVPSMRSIQYEPAASDFRVGNFGILVNPMHVNYYPAAGRVQFADDSQLEHPGLEEGKWVLIHTQQRTRCGLLLDILHHARITEKYGRNIEFCVESTHPVPSTPVLNAALEEFRWESGITPARLVSCESLDELENDNEKMFSMALLLMSLPSIDEMTRHLLQSPSHKLSTWNRIPPGAMKLLRWIIASNHSYIFQLDNNAATLKLMRENRGVGQVKDRRLERISGVDGWLQFKFAQGSPETEACFRISEKEADAYRPTVLAWYGHQLWNWHSIVRHGLMANPALGRGLRLNRYLADSRSLHENDRGEALENPGLIWPGSSLKIQEAVSVVALPNMPKGLLYSDEACYVVDKKHWVQCRYLLARPAVQRVIQAPPCRHHIRYQPMWTPDPMYEIKGQAGAKVRVPLSALPSANRDPGDNRRHESSDDDLEADGIDGTDSQESQENQENPENQENQEKRMWSIVPRPRTDFVPGTQDLSIIDYVGLPSYANHDARFSIQLQIRDLKVLQKSTPKHSLGWYIDFSSITLERMYQWVVEFHSLPAGIALAQEMKYHRITSIIVEIRFLRGFPRTPPFVRIVWPRLEPWSPANEPEAGITRGGSFCIKMLTASGWDPTCSLATVLTTVRRELCVIAPENMRLKPLPELVTPSGDANIADATAGAYQYSLDEAVETFKEAVVARGWEAAEELDEIL
ncbi:hypothetical protein GGR50DRAFT_690664 [Xylaria sp. CBS 124048]|nr:hypothetical protein GGR50DRAFT_690664 [Xylaria sp. CBS 124048]